MKHFEIVRAANAEAAQVVPNTIRNYEELGKVLKALAYVIDAENEWHVLGLAPLEGPDITLHVIESRLRAARLLATASEANDWTEDDKDNAKKAIHTIEAAS